jgi:hypothetical protein
MYTFALTKNIKAKLYSIFENGVEIVRSLTKRKVLILLDRLNFEQRSTRDFQSDRVCQTIGHDNIAMSDSGNITSQTRIHCPSTQVRSESEISSVSATRAITCDGSNSTYISTSTRELFAKSRETNTSPFDSILRTVTDSYRTVTDSYRTVTDSYRTVTDSYRTVTDSYRTICNEYKSLNRAMLNSLISGFEQSNGCSPADYLSGLYKLLEPTTIEVNSTKL